MTPDPSPEEVNSVFVRTLVATEHPTELSDAQKIAMLERENYDWKMRHRILRMEMDKLRSHQPDYFYALEDERNVLVARLASEQAIREAAKRAGRWLFWVSIFGPVVALAAGFVIGRL